MEATAREYFTLRDGSRLRYVDKGAGPPLVLIHGYPSNIEFSWKEPIGLLSQRHRVIAMDLLGFGWSDRPLDGDYTFGAQAGRVAELIQGLGLASPVVVGTSFGGGVAEHLASQRPDLIGRLVLIAPVDASLPPSWLPEGGRAAGLMFVWRLMGLPLAGPRIGQFVARALSPADSRDDESVADVVGPLLRPGLVRWSLKMQSDLRGEKAVNLSLIRSPTLILTGAEDRTIKPADSEALSRKIAGARFDTIPGFGHGFISHNPAILADRLDFA